MKKWISRIFTGRGRVSPNSSGSSDAVIRACVHTSFTDSAPSGSFENATRRARRYKRISQMFDREFNEECSVCLDPCEGSIVMLPCSHTFHTKCMFDVMMASTSPTTCPICRHPTNRPESEFIELGDSLVIVSF